MWRRVSELRSFQGQILFLTYSLTFTAGMCTKEEKKWQLSSADLTIVRIWQSNCEFADLKD